MQRFLAVLVLCASVVRPALAQVHGSGDGYLFGAPSVRLSGRVGYAHANAGSDLFTDLTNQFILSKSDFSSVALGGEAGYQVAPRLEFSLSVDYAGSRKGSEYRHLIDNNNQPIEQTTRFERVPIMANARFSLASPGRQIGRLAWIPSRIVPWIGGGGGAIWYRLKQTGDFVDAATNTVGYDELSSDGWTMAAQVMGGVDVGITPRLSLTTDVRSIWARAALDGDYSGFERLDLSGVSATLGLTIRL